jgi:hypothetical protein
MRSSGRVEAWLLFVYRRALRVTVSAPLNAAVMPHHPMPSADYQRIVVISIWAVFLLTALRQGVDLPGSELVTISPNRFVVGIPLFGLFAPPILVRINGLTQSRRPGAQTPTWIERVIDSRLGTGAARAFWFRLRPVSLMAAGCFVLGASGLISSVVTDAPLAAFETSSFFLAAGVGFFSALLIERHVFNRTDVA